MLKVQGWFSLVWTTQGNFNWSIKRSGRTGSQQWEREIFLKTQLTLKLDMMMMMMMISSCTCLVAPIFIYFDLLTSQYDHSESLKFLTNAKSWEKKLSCDINIPAMWLFSKSFLLSLYLDFLCVLQLDATPFCENYAKLYFDAKHLEKGLNKGWWNVWCHFPKKCPFWFSSLGPVYAR